MRRHFHALLHAGVIALLCGLIYSNTLEAPFVFDDPRSITENTHIRISSLDPGTLLAAAYESPLHRPVASLSFALTYYFWKYDVTAYHVGNTLVHALNGLLVYWLALIVFARSFGNERKPLSDVRLRGLALFSACLFVAHPLQIQSVTYIVQRMNSLSTMFYLLALLLYLVGRSVESHEKRGALWLGSSMSWVLALGAKENAATLPVIILLYELLLAQDLRLRSIRNVLWKAAAVGVLALPVIVGYWSRIWPRLASYATADFSLWERILTQCRVVVLYGSLVLYPHPDRFNLLHKIDMSRSLVDPVSTLASLILIIAVLTLAFWAARRIPLVSFCILWIGVNLVIESLVVHEDMIFEHRMYLPMVGVVLLAGYGLGRVPERMWKWTAALGVFVVLLLGTATHVRNRVWSDEVTLWSDVASKSKGDTRILTNLGNALHRVGRFEEAIRHQQRAVEINPNSAALHNNLGAAMMHDGQVEQALVHFTESARLEPGLGSVHANMGLALQELGRVDEAVKAFAQAVRVQPRFAMARYHFAMALSEQGRTEEALAQLNVAVRNNPEDAMAFYGMGRVQQQQRSFEEAERSFRRALTIDPGHWEAYLSLGLALDRRRQLDAAATAFSEALRINPRSANAHSGLGVTLIRAGKLNEARNHFLEALRIDPDNATARANLNRINAE